MAFSLNFLSCDDGKVSSDSTGIKVNFGECKHSADSYKAKAVEDIQTGQECVTIAYAADSGILRIDHQDAAFNCCLKSLAADVAIDDGIITINESEIYTDGMACDCMCLYDINYDIPNVAPGEYTVNISGPYGAGDDKKIQFVVSLTAQATETFCFKRTGYPWNSGIE
jgi:hypothetical protein